MAAQPDPVSAHKATKKLTKKLGRAPTDAELSAYVAKQLTKKLGGERAGAGTTALSAVAGATGLAAAGVGSCEVGGEKDPWVDSVGEPPRKGQVPDGKGGWHWPPRPPPTGNNSIVLFYGYVHPLWDRHGQDAVIEFARESLSRNKCTGRLRVAREGLNGTLMGSHDGIRTFTKELTEWHRTNHKQNRVHGQSTDNPWSFKFVDKQPDNVMEKELKVFPVSELVTYGFPRDSAASITAGGTHLSAAEYHKAMEDPNAVMVDVRNFNESVIGKFAPPGIEVLDPQMRRSTEFPRWVDDNIEKLQGKKVLMYCTGGIRCERASSYLIDRGLTDVNQCEGGIHKYLEDYNEDGGYWKGLNYTFDKRFSHGAKNAEIISKCVLCDVPWERYAARKKCRFCRMEVLVCRTCDRGDKAKREAKVPIDKLKLICPLCQDPKTRKVNRFGVQG